MSAMWRLPHSATSLRPRYSLTHSLTSPLTHSRSRTPSLTNSLHHSLTPLRRLNVLAALPRYSHTHSLPSPITIKKEVNLPLRHSLTHLRNLTSLTSSSSSSTPSLTHSPTHTPPPSHYRHFSTNSSTPSLTHSPTPQEIFRSDYRPPDYSIDTVHMSFHLHLERTIVTTRSSVFRHSDANTRPDLVLDGEDLELRKVSIDGHPLAAEDYTVTPSSLTISSEVLSRFPMRFELSTEVQLCPRRNLALSGLYTSSSDLLCTQCEAMGFRRITYHLDRPDVLSKYHVYMEGSKTAFPTLLCNGNLLSSGDVAEDNSRHFAVWDDPFPKPSYLFGLVAGPLVSLTDTFTTRSGREVQLGIFTKPSSNSSADVSIAKCRHALQSLKQSMHWDEQVFGLECDLSTYNVVAVDDFNMGAMENKGLNIFNSAYVLVDPASATDSDYCRVLSVIGHEYFHNWTGNRITLRDWFQLTLKEGLTVFRDQWFTADLMKGKGVQRIEDVNTLRSAQFMEDSGPTAHPIRPESYIAMDNFYTSTVYLKGAEIVRMYHTLLGEEGFLRGMALYVSRHDGQAVTCDDFLAAMKDANPGVESLETFGRWYEQPGTPLLTVENTELDTMTKSFSITFSQKNQKETESSEETPLPPLTIPILTSIFDKDSGALLSTALLVLDEQEKTFHFDNVTSSSVVVSPLQEFSAPVRLAFPQQTEEDLMFLLQHDTDAFNKWECQQRVSSRVMLQAAAAPDSETPFHYLEAIKQILQSVKNTPAGELGTLAALLSPPSFSSLLQMERDNTCSDLDALHYARVKVMHDTSVAVEKELFHVYESLAPTSLTYEFTNEENSRRSLRNECLRLITAMKYTKNSSSPDIIARDEAAAKLRVNLAMDQYFISSGVCMTDTVAALSSLLAIQHPYAKPFQENALEHYFDMAENDPLVVNKWFAMQAAVDSPEVFETVKTLKDHPSFTMTNPNAVRALIGSFAANTAQFHHPSGRGYNFLADCVLELDEHNPQMAAKLVHSLSQWKRLDSSRQVLMRGALQKIESSHRQLSPDTYEIVHRSLQA